LLVLCGALLIGATIGLIYKLTQDTVTPVTPVNPVNPVILPKMISTTVDKIISRSTWIKSFPWGPEGNVQNANCHHMLPKYKETYKYDNFIKACKYFPDFGAGTYGKREVAAFLAHVAHETTGTGYGKLNGGLCYMNELACYNMAANKADPNYKGEAYCSTTANDAINFGPGGVRYFGRGAI
jgi:hypothetical protein